MLLHCRLELMSESSESGALSLSSAARHIDFHLLHRIYVVLVAHSIALSLQNVQKHFLTGGEGGSGPAPWHTLCYNYLTGQFGFKISHIFGLSYFSSHRNQTLKPSYWTHLLFSINVDWWMVHGSLKVSCDFVIICKFIGFHESDLLSRTVEVHSGDELTEVIVFP